MAERVIIAGGGVVGRTIAVALANQTHLGVTLLAGDAHRSDERASAVSASAQRMLGRIGVWPLIADAAQPIEEMVITDSSIHDAIRPEVLSFEGGAGASAFAFMVPNNALHQALETRCRALEIEELPTKATFFEDGDVHVSISLEGGGDLTGDVLIAADGRQSRLRKVADISVVQKDYDQYGIVGTLSHARPHDGRAVQHFLPNGPFAMLPLKGEQSSIVWTERPAFAKSLAEMDPSMASLEIERVFGLSLGRLCVEPPLQVYPLSLMLARHLTQGRLALAGDAAHVFHPLAGQGLNIGLRDAAALVEVLADAHRNGEDLSAALPRYERWRRADVTQMALVTDRLNAIFSRRSDLLRAIRSIGLGLIDRRASLKALFISEAAGFEGDVPRLMRGEAI